jgi:hypothetical protein
METSGYIAEISLGSADLFPEVNNKNLVVDIKFSFILHVMLAVQN